VLTQDGKDAFQMYLDKGGNFIGVHSATDCLNTTEFFGKEIGAYFDYHPEITNAVSIALFSHTSNGLIKLVQIVDVLDSSHPSTSKLPSQWHIQDEMYDWSIPPLISPY
jgi:hypothetical protein